MRKLLTPGWLAFTALVFVAAAVFCWLGWWQWQRYQEMAGSLQNLAYTVQWPIFAGFGVYLWWRMLRDTARGAPEPDPAAVEAATLIEAERERRAGNAVLLARDVEIDDELMAYNRYLAALNAADTARADPARADSALVVPEQGANDRAESNR